MELTPQKRKKAEKLANLLENGNLAILEYLLELDDKIESEIPSIKEVIARVKGDKGDSYILTQDDKETIAEIARYLIDDKEIANKVYDLIDFKAIAREASTYIPTPKDGKNGEKGKDGISPDPLEIASEASKIAIEAIAPLVPTVEEVTKNVPILGERVRDALELLEGEERLDASAIKNLPEATKTIVERVVATGGGTQPVKAGTNVTITYDGNGAPVINATGGGGTPGGSNTQVQYNNNGDFGAEAGFEYDKVNNVLDVYETEGAELVTNGTFTGSASGWTVGAGWAYSNNSVSHTSNGTAAVFNSMAITPGAWYRFRFSVTNRTVGSATFIVGGVGFTVSANGDYVYDVFAQTTGNIIVSPSSTSRLTIDNISLKRITGGGINTGTLQTTVPIDTPSGGWGSAMTPTTIANTGTINNLALTSGFLIFTGSGAKTLTGLVGNTAVAKHAILMNQGSGALTINHASSSSSANNQFTLPGSANYVIPVGQAAMFSYDTVNDRWYLSAPRYFFNSAQFSLSDTNTVSLTGDGLSKWTQTATALYPTVERTLIIGGAGVDDGSGAKAQFYAGSSCQGTPTACSTYNSNSTACNAQAGCSFAANSCPSATDEEACNLLGSPCAWEAAFCGGNNSAPNTCPNYTDESSCNGDPSGMCSWDGTTCTGDNSVPNTCTSFGDEATCNSNSPCAWVAATCSGNNQACNGTASACSTFTSNGTCTAQAGCSWTEADAINAHGNSTFESLELNTAASKPTCSSSIRGRFWFTQNGAGVKDSVEVCAKDAGDAYAWRTIY